MVNYTEAVQQKRSIRFTYDGLERVVIPAAHGLHASTGKEMIRGFQTEGWTHSPEAPTPWRLFTVSKIFDANLTDDVAPNAPEGYRVGDTHLSPIYAEFGLVP